MVWLLWNARVAGRRMTHALEGLNDKAKASLRILAADGSWTHVYFSPYPSLHHRHRKFFSTCQSSTFDVWRSSAQWTVTLSGTRRIFVTVNRYKGRILTLPLSRKSWLFGNFWNFWVISRSTRFPFQNILTFSVQMTEPSAHFFPSTAKLCIFNVQQNVPARNRKLQR